jgi:hypothetical protein
MGRTENDEIAGMVDSHGQYICSNCMTEEEWDSVAEDRIVSRQDVDEDEAITWCERCKKRM